MKRFLPLIALASCGVWEAEPRWLPVDSYVASEPELDRVHRIMVLPFDADEGVDARSSTIRRELITALMKARRFEVAPLPSSAPEARELHRSISRGQLSTDALVALRRRYHIDGVVLGQVTAMRAYPPVRLGTRVRLVSLFDGATVWAAEGMWDSNDARVQEDVQNYAGSFQAEEASMHGWRLNLISPARYTKYVAHRIVGTVLRNEVSQ